MYVPSSFQINDSNKLAAFLEANSFGTLVTSDGGVPFATQLPMRPLCDDTGVCTRLVSHMARANPQWQSFANSQEVLAIFNGPHAYISPSWYTVTEAVPTWNYASVHVYGRPRIIEDHEEVASLLADTIHFYEQSQEHPWPGHLTREYRDKMIRAIVAFELVVTRIEGKFKLGQNRSVEDIESVYNKLAYSSIPGDRELAKLMLSEKLAGHTDKGES